MVRARQAARQCDEDSLQILSVRCLVTRPNKPANPQPVAADASSITSKSLKYDMKNATTKM
jgi:hypothetical protein